MLQVAGGIAGQNEKEEDVNDLLIFRGKGRGGLKLAAFMKKKLVEVFPQSFVESCKLHVYGMIKKSNHVYVPSPHPSTKIFCMKHETLQVRRLSQDSRESKG